LIERGLEPLIGFECASNWKPSLTAGSVARAAFPTIGGIPAACFQVSVVRCIRVSRWATNQVPYNLGYRTIGERGMPVMAFRRWAAPARGYYVISPVHVVPQHTVVRQP
jgi:hypothetical protein